VNPVLDYITKLVWDGVPRLEKWLIDFGGAKDTEFVRAVSRIVLVAAVRRVRQPGSLFQEMLVLESSQGQSKSTSIAALCPHDDWFSDDLPLNVDAKQLIERTSGKWIIEASDLSGMRKGDIEHLKAMLSRCVDGPVRMAYDHFPLERPRAFILIGTTNSSLYLKDPTGGRRFWPVRVGMFQIDLLRAVRDQLWAEAAHYEGRGESIRLAQNLWGDAAKEQEQRRVVDTWEEILRDSDIDFTASHVPSDSIWALLGASHSDPRNAERLAPIMQHLGYPRKHRCRYNGRNGMHWVREDAEFELVAERPDFIQRSEN
jgi:predicted P-loop ATPase